MMGGYADIHITCYNVLYIYKTIEKRKSVKMKSWKNHRGPYSLPIVISKFQPVHNKSSTTPWKYLTYQKGVKLK